MLDEVFFKKHLDRHPTNYIYLGMVCAIVGIISGAILFGRSQSVAAMLFVTIMLMPAIRKLVDKEEKLERKFGIHNFWKVHAGTIEIYFFIFTGVFLGYLLMELIFIMLPDVFADMFNFQMSTIKANEDFILGVFDGSVTGSLLVQALSQFALTVLFYVVICFALSYFYGAGGVVLLVTGASIFATMVIFIMRLFDFFVHYSAMLLISVVVYFLPMILGLITAAIAGAVISKAFVYEKIGSKPFFHVFEDSMLLLFISIAFIVVGVILQGLATQVIATML